MTCNLTSPIVSETRSITIPSFKPQTTDFEAHRILRIKDVCYLLGCSKSMLYLYLSPKSKYYKPDFPKQLKLADRAKGWKASDVYAYINQLQMKEVGHE